MQLLISKISLYIVILGITVCVLFSLRWFWIARSQDTNALALTKACWQLVLSSKSYISIDRDKTFLIKDGRDYQQSLNNFFSQNNLQIVEQTGSLITAKDNHNNQQSYLLKKFTRDFTIVIRIKDL